MFDAEVFQSWASVLFGGVVFALLFGFVGMMSGLVMDGELHVTRLSIALSMLAFVGYVGVASALRLKKEEKH